MRNANKRSTFDYDTMIMPIDGKSVFPTMCVLREKEKSNRIFVPAKKYGDMFLIPHIAEGCFWTKLCHRKDLEYFGLLDPIVYQE